VIQLSATADIQPSATADIQPSATADIQPSATADTTNLHTYPTLFIQQVQYPKFCLYEINARLVVIKIYEFPLYLFFQIFLLFQLEYVLSQAQHTSHIIAVHCYHA
jgi:hypothetical protein